ncbi:hypothetical protein SRHO_G00165240 [Serrasalmus rhombeus]
MWKWAERLHPVRPKRITHGCSVSPLSSRLHQAFINGLTPAARSRGRRPRNVVQLAAGSHRAAPFGQAYYTTATIPVRLD